MSSEGLQVYKLDKRVFFARERDLVPNKLTIYKALGVRLLFLIILNYSLIQGKNGYL